jgi:pimeloyl-ACP methyl ester carboxylesterase
LTVQLTVVLISTFVFLSAGYRLFSNFSKHSQHINHEAHNGFTWDHVKPSTSLHYVPCFSEFQCARLSVPLNWGSPTEERENGPQATIAVIKLPAKVPVTDPRYGGSILLNPGGPGESGIYQVLTDGNKLQEILTDPDSSDLYDESKHFDILSFDPRGVNNSRPQLRCYADAFNQQAWLLSLPDYGQLWHSESTIGLEWARAEALGASCSYGEDENGILRHLNTAQTVEDMLQIVEKHGEWRDKEAKAVPPSKRHGGPEASQQIMERTKYRPGEEKIQYWGMSYGTVIGSTFAAMHPDRIGRLIIDGVVDPADHYAGAWRTQLQDSDMIMTKFCEYCFHAGPSECPLYTGTSPVDVEERLTSILNTLEKSPIAMPPSLSSSGRAGPALVTYGDMHLELLSAMYFPYAMAETFFDLLAAVESRNTSSPGLVNIVRKKQAALDPYPDGPIPYVSGFGPFQAISCMDSGGPTNLTREGFAEHVAELQSQGRWISRSWSRNKLGCLGYTDEPAWRPSIAFETQEWANTSHPLLIIGNTHDTVTPLRNARRVSTLFPGSVVLQQNSQGHCSHSTPSLCTAKTVRQYFQTGRLPPDGTVCEPAMRPFVGCTDGVNGGRGKCAFENPADQKLWESMVELADPFGLRS